MLSSSGSLSVAISQCSGSRLSVDSAGSARLEESTVLDLVQAVKINCRWENFFSRKIGLSQASVLSHVEVGERMFLLAMAKIISSYTVTYFTCLGFKQMVHMTKICTSGS